MGNLIKCAEISAVFHYSNQAHNRSS